MDPVRKAIMLKRLKAQITNLHFQEGQKIAIQMEKNEMMGGGYIPLPIRPCTEKRDSTNNTANTGCGLKHT